ncbi:MAG: RICIN domain-containing protein [Lachnospiraceae bacterium]|nr:RICIN domain-containing protein [Lachnospiraceae bacterium]
MKKIIKAFAIMILTVAAFITLSPTEDAKADYKGGEQVIPDGNYRIMTAVNPLYGLDIHGNSLSSGTNIQLYRISENDVPVFKVEYIGDGYYRIMVPESNMSLDVEGACSWYDGANLMIYPYHGGDNHLWVIEDSGDGKNFFIRSKLDGRCIDVESYTAHNNANVHMWRYHGDKNQQWQFVREEEELGIKDITAFSMVNGIRLRWSNESDTDDTVYHIDKETVGPYSVSSSSAFSASDYFMSVLGEIPSWLSSYPAGVEVRYKLNDEDEAWVTKDISLSGNTKSLDITGLLGGAEYIFSIRPYYKTRHLGVTSGEKKYKQDWSEEIKRTTLEANEEDIRIGDNVYSQLSYLARRYGWHAGRHVQYYTGSQYCKYDIVSKNADFQMWIGYYRKGSKVRYSWRVYDYDLKLYKKVQGGTYADLKNDLAVYAAGSSMVRLSTEYLAYEVGTKQKLTILNTGNTVKWSLPKTSDSKMTYDGVRLAKVTDNSVVVVFEDKRGAHDIYPYVQAKVGKKIYRCYIDNKISGNW